MGRDTAIPGCTLRTIARSQWWVGAVVLAALILASLAQVGNGSAASDLRTAAGSSCVRPYSDSSPWNTAIGGDPAYAPDSGRRVGQINGELSSDPSQFTYPVYTAARSRPVTKVKVLEAISKIRRGGAALSNRKRGTLRIPLPKGARASTQTGQLIVVDPKSGEEWGVFGLGRQGRGWTALFGYKFSTKTDGVPAIGKDGGGLAARAGVSYLAGLVRACEIASGKIDHALALAFGSASIAHITPLRGTNGSDGSPDALQVGARLQLDPDLSQADLAELGCAGACYTMAQAMQEYGAFVVGRSGRPKIYVEHNFTARWRGAVRADTVSAIPVDRLRVLDLAGELRLAKKFKRTKPRAGKVLRAFVDVVPATADAGARGRVICSATIGAKRALKPIRALATSLQGGIERAECRWRIPADAKGQKVDASLKVVYQHGGVRKDFAARIAR